MACLGLSAEEDRDVLIAVRRAGLLEFDDPKTLLPISQIEIDLPANNTGLNGVFASADGLAFYVEGPTSPDEKGESGCCLLYSIDLKTLHTKVAASIWGSSSRGSLLVADRVVYPLSAATAKIAAIQLIDNAWHISPNGRWLLGINRQQQVVTIYDLSGGTEARRLQIPETNDGW